VSCVRSSEALGGLPSRRISHLRRSMPRTGAAYIVRRTHACGSCQDRWLAGCRVQARGGRISGDRNRPRGFRHGEEKRTHRAEEEQGDPHRRCRDHRVVVLEGLPHISPGGGSGPVPADQAHWYGQFRLVRTRFAFDRDAARAGPAAGPQTWHGPQGWECRGEDPAKPARPVGAAHRGASDLSALLP
jgi:hypothetical protein